MHHTGAAPTIETDSTISTSTIKMPQSAEKYEFGLAGQSTLRSEQDELTGWADVLSINTASAIRKVTDFVKAIKEATGNLATGALGSLPPVSIYSSFPSSNSSRNISIAASASSLPLNSTRTGEQLTLTTDLCTAAGCASGTTKPSVVSADPDWKDRVDASTSKPETSQDKEKSHNFVSADAGARVLAASAGTFGAKNVLDNNIDKYLLTPCQVDEKTESRWIDIELSEDVILEKFQTGSHEYVSSSPRKVILSSASSYPSIYWIAWVCLILQLWILYNCFTLRNGLSLGFWRSSMLTNKADSTIVRSLWSARLERT